MKNNNFVTSSYIVVNILLVAVAVIAMSTFINRPTPIQNTILLIEPVVLKQGHYQPITEYIVSGKPYNIRLSANLSFVSQGFVNMLEQVGDRAVSTQGAGVNTLFVGNNGTDSTI